MYANVALGILGSLPMAIEGTNRLFVDIAMFFGLQVIVAMALNFQYGNAGIPNMGCAVQVIIGAFSVSAIVLRVMFTVIAQREYHYRIGLMITTGSTPAPSIQVLRTSSSRIMLS